MITKEQCLPNTRVVVNEKYVKINKQLGATSNGLFAFSFQDGGGITTKTPIITITKGCIITLLSKPKMFNGNGNQVLIELDGSGVVWSTYWSCLKSKVDLI
jgi:hypothetical protein